MRTIKLTIEVEVQMGDDCEVFGGESEMSYPEDLTAAQLATMLKCAVGSIQCAADELAAGGVYLTGRSTH